MAMMIFLSTPCSINAGSCSSAAEKKFSPGKNNTMNSGAGWNCSQYALRVNVSTCPRMLLAWRWSNVARSPSWTVRAASKYASMGTFASMTTVFPAGRRTTMSGRWRPSSTATVVCSVKSQ